MLTPVYETRFRKDIKLAMKRDYNMQKLKGIIALLVKEISLPPKNRNHPLKGNHRGYFECHIAPDRLLIYRKTNPHIYFTRTRLFEVIELLYFVN